MSAQPHLYGLDLITDAEGSSVDPHSNRILAIGLSTHSGEERYDGDEIEILTLIDRRLQMLREGVIVTWNGAVLGLPMIALRAQRLGVDIQLQIALDHRRPAVLDSPLNGLERPVWGSWHGHSHLDLSRVYEQDARRWNPLRARRQTPESHLPATDELVHRDPIRDARLTRALAERRWAQARRLVDRMPSAVHV